MSVVFDCIYLVFTLFRAFLNNPHASIYRGGPIPSTSLPPTPKTKSGTPVSVAGDGSATGGIKPWTPGQRWVCVYVCVVCLCVKAAVCLPLSYLCTDRSRHSRRLCQIPSVTSAVVAGRSVKSPEVGWHCGLCPCRERYSLCIHGNALLDAVSF